MQIRVSWLRLYSVVSEMVGALVPVRVLKSPQVMTKFVAGIAERMVATASFASCSQILRLRSDSYGGRYTLVMLACYPSGNLTTTDWAYSLPLEERIGNEFLTRRAMPPLVPAALLCSSTVKPGIASSPCWSPTSHVSYTHKTSNLCSSSSLNSFQCDAPAMFSDPTLTP